MTNFPTITDRQRLWHPRGSLCAVCRQPTRGFGWRDPHQRKHSRSYFWFCSIACQGFWAARAQASSGWHAGMVDLTEEERAAITATMRRVALLMEEIGWQTKLADLTEPQVRALIEEAVEGFREAMADIAKSQSQEIPF